MGSKKGGRTFRYTAALVGGLMTLALTSPASGQPKPKPQTGKPTADATKPKSEREKREIAKNSFKQAEDKFNAGDCAAAIPLYEEADANVPGAMPKYKIATCLDKMNRASDAISAYQRFLDFKPDTSKFQDKIDEAKARQEALRKTPATVKVAITPAAPPDLKVEVDGVAQANATSLTIPPGKHKITAVAPGYEPATQEIDVAFGEAKEISIPMTKSSAPVAAAPPPAVPPPPTTTPPPAPPPEPRSNVPAYVTLGLAGAGIVVGTVFGVQALGSKSDYEDAPTQEKFDDTERSALLADLSYGIALTFGVTGIVLLLSNQTEPAKAALVQPKPKTAQKPAFTPYVGTKGGGAAATFRF